MRTELLIIGDEILNGETLDTNSQYIAQQLAPIGLAVERITKIRDRNDLICEALHEAFQRSELVITTGGLGPTKDDLTYQAIANFLGCELKFDEQTYNHIRKRYEERGLEMNELARKVAMVPERAQAMPNPVGTAPPLWAEHGKKLLIVLPGVPHETQFIFEHNMVPLLRQRYHGHHIRHHKLIISGLRESELALKLGPLEEELPGHIRMSYLPSLGYVKVRFTSDGEDAQALEAELQLVADRVRKLVPGHVAGEQEDNFNTLLKNLLIKKQVSVATAESCTGGYLAHQFTSIPGSSRYFMGSCVAYHNEVKEKVLGVKHETLEQHGAVSRQTVEEMVSGAVKLYGADYAIATSGIAGPAGGQPGKPVGTVWIAAGNKDRCITKRFLFNRDRMQNIILSANMGMDLLRRLLEEQSNE